jgi:hypothetical protein
MHRKARASRVTRFLVWRGRAQREQLPRNSETFPNNRTSNYPAVFFTLMRNALMPSPESLALAASSVLMLE